MQYTCLGAENGSCTVATPPPFLNFSFIYLARSASSDFLRAQGLPTALRTLWLIRTFFKNGKFFDWCPLANRKLFDFFSLISNLCLALLPLKSDLFNLFLIIWLENGCRLICRWTYCALPAEKILLLALTLDLFSTLFQVFSALLYIGYFSGFDLSLF